MKNIREIIRGSSMTSLEFTNKTNTEEIALLEDKFNFSSGLIAGSRNEGNYTEIEKDGTVSFKGNATVWGDLTSSLIARRLNSTTGTLKYNYNQNSITMEPSGDPTSATDRLVFNYQKPHAAKESSKLRLHIHWWQVNNDKIEWQIDYRIQDNSSLKTEDWITVTVNSTDNSVFTYPGEGTFNQITKLVDIDWSNVGISATIQVRLTRIDSTANSIEATFVDGHVEYDTLGSRAEYVK